MQKELEKEQMRLATIRLPPTLQAARRRAIQDQEREFTEAVRQRKKHLFQESLKDLSQPQARASFLKMVSCRQARNSRSHCQLDPAKLPSYSSYFASTFAGSPTVFCDIPATTHYQSKRIDTARVESILKCAPLGKSPGVDGLLGEMFHYGANIMAPVLTKLFQTIYDTCQIPQEWKEAMIVPIYKKKGDMNDIANYRPIALTCVARRLFERTILDEISPFMDQIHDFQSGFRPKRSTLHQAMCLHEFMTAHPGLHCVFLDFKAAYDLVPRTLLWKKLLDKFNIPRSTVNRLQALFDYNRSFIIVSGKKGPPINNNRGLLQGSSLSPILFNFFINDIITNLYQEGPKVRLDGYGLNSLWFADDGCLLAKNVAAMKILLEIAEQWSIINGMVFAPLKCVYLGPTWTQGASELTIYNHKLPAADSFRYLGLIFNASGIDWPRHITPRTEKARTVAQSISRFGMNLCGWPIETSALVYKLFIRPIFEYGLCITSHPSDIIQLLGKTQRFALRRMFNADKNIAIAALEKLALIEPISTRLMSLQLRFAHNLHNSIDGRIPAVCVWRNCLQTARRNSTPRSILKHPWWKDVPKINFILHPTTRLQSKIEASKMPILYKSFIKTKIMSDILALPGGIAESIQLNSTFPRRHITCNDAQIPLTQRTTIYLWLYGNVCRHQPCQACNAQELSREHGVLCSGAAQFLEQKVPPQLLNGPGKTKLDALLNRCHRGPPSELPEAYEIAFKAISMIQTKCRGLKITENGFWKMPEQNSTTASIHPQSPVSSTVVVSIRDPILRPIPARNRIPLPRRGPTHNPHNGGRPRWSTQSIDELINRAKRQASNTSNPSSSTDENTDRLGRNR